MSSRCGLFLVNPICFACPGSDFVFICFFLGSVFDRAQTFQRPPLTIETKKMDGFQKMEGDQFPPVSPLLTLIFQNLRRTSAFYF